MIRLTEKTKNILSNMGIFMLMLGVALIILIFASLIDAELYISEILMVVGLGLVLISNKAGTKISRKEMYKSNH